MRGKFMCCGPLLVIKTASKHEVLISIYVSIRKAPNGTFDHQGEKCPCSYQLRATVQSNVNNQDYHKQNIKTLLYTLVSTLAD